MYMKIERDELKSRFVALFDEEITFSCDKNINPFECSFHSIKYYVYIKNISPAYFNNPDVWRIQLPIRDIFNDIKESDSKFLLLGYDSVNNVYTTWNPYWAKQRLNIAESVSFYSRLSLQEEAGKKKIVIEKELNNDNKVLIFPSSLAIFVLDSLNNYFPEETKYVAVGSKRRSDANNAYKKFISESNISEFENYVMQNIQYTGTAPDTVKRLLNIAKTYKNIFLTYDSLSNYGEAIDRLCRLMEENPIKDSECNLKKELLKDYLNFVINGSSCLIKEETEPKEEKLDGKIGNINEYFEYLQNKDKYIKSINQINKKLSKDYFYWRDFLDLEILYENKQYLIKYHHDDTYWNFVQALMDIEDIKKYRHKHNLYVGALTATLSYIEEINESRGIHHDIIDENDKLKKITNPKLIKQLQPVLCQKYRNLAQAYDIVYDFYKDRFRNMDLKDWSKLFDDLSSNNHVYTPISKFHSTKKILRVEFPNGTIIQEKHASETLVKVIKLVGPDKVRNLNILNNCDNLITDTINPLYNRSYKPLENGLFICTCSNTNKKAQQIDEISQTLNLHIKISQIDQDDIIKDIKPKNEIADFSFKNKNEEITYNYQIKKSFSSNAAEELPEMGDTNNDEYF